MHTPLCRRNYHISYDTHDDDPSQHFHQSIHPPTHLSVSPSTSASVRTCMHAFIHPYVHVRSWIHPSAHLSNHHPHIHPFTHSHSVRLSIHPSISPAVTACKWIDWLLLKPTLQSVSQHTAAVLQFPSEKFNHVNPCNSRYCKIYFVVF
jgi:hypothetical protein